MNIAIVPISEILKDPKHSLSAEDWVSKKEYEPNNFGSIFEEECRKLRENRYKEICGGCEHYFNPLCNVLCNYKGRCRRMIIMESANVKDNYTPKKKEVGNDSM